MTDSDPRTDDELVAYMDRALPAEGAEAASVRARLASDAAFARRAEELAALDALLGELRADVAAPGAAAGVVAAALLQARRERLRRALRAAAAVVFVAGGSTAAWRFVGAADPRGAPAEVARAIEDYAAPAPADEAGGTDELEQVEAALALIERVDADYFSE